MAVNLLNGRHLFGTYRKDTEPVDSRWDYQWESTNEPPLSVDVGCYRLRTRMNSRLAVMQTATIPKEGLNGGERLSFLSTDDAVYPSPRGTNRAGV